MIPGSANPLLLTTTATGYTISRSIRLNAPDSAYLSRTPASAGNRKTWTWAGWVKRSTLNSSGGTYQQLFTAGSSGAVRDVFFFDQDVADTLAFYSVGSGFGGGVLLFRTNAVFRDSSAWYHIVLAVDSTQATAANRIKLYVNGVQQTFSTANYPSQNSDGLINSTTGHAIGRDQGQAAQYLNGYLADIHFIDGQALDPTSFGEFSATTGVWVPKAYTGTYGTNGFRLTFADNSAATATTLGKDAAGSNNWTPNNLSVSSGPATFAGSFDGSSGNYWTVNSNSALDMGTGDFTVECWVRLNAMPTGEIYSSAKWIFGTGPTNLTTGSQLYIGQSNLHFDLVSDGSNEVNAAHGMTTNTWYHVAVTRSGTSIRGFVNGQQKGSTTTTSSSWVGGYGWGIAAAEAGSSLAANFNGQISNLRVIKGSALYTANFTPPSAALTAVSGTSLLTLRSSSATDLSGNSLTVTPNGSVPITGAYPFGDPAGNDSLVDVPVNGAQTDTGVGGEVRGNYCTLNPLDKGSNVTLTNGNLDVSTNSTWNSVRATFGITSGKWYWEYTMTAAGYTMVGIGTRVIDLAGYIGQSSAGYAYYSLNGNKWNGGSAASYGNSFTTNDVVGVAFDADAGKIWFSKNGTWQASGDPAAGTNAAYTSIPSSTYFPTISQDNSLPASTGGTLNAGARSFAYTAPSGFKALCTANLSAGTITTSGSFTGNANADGPFVYLNGVPTAMTINGNAVTFGTHADKLSNGFKLRSSSTSYNTAGSNTYSITTTGAKFNVARAQPNP